MAQTLVPIDLIKDRQIALAIDTAAQILSDAGFVSGGTQTSEIVGVAGRKLTTSTATNTVTMVASGTDSNIDVILTSQGSGAIGLAGTTLANSAFKAVPTTSAVNQWIATGAATGSPPSFLAGGGGSDATLGATFGTVGTGTLNVVTSTSEVQLQVTRTASAVNNLTITGSISTNPVVLAPIGTGATLGMHLQAKSTGAIFLGGATTAAASLQVATVATAVNQFIATPAATGNPAILSIGGSGADANAALLITALASGTGSVYVGGGGTLTTASLEVGKVSSSVNTVKIVPAATGNAPQITVAGAGGDANRDIQISGIGTGAARVKGGTGAVAAAAGYVGEAYGDMVFGTGTTATVTLTQAAPGVITWTGHGFSAQAYQPVVFTTTGALPTNIVSGTVYYATIIDANTFKLSTTVANAIAGTFIDTTAGSNTGTQTGTAGCKMANTTAIDITGLALTAGDWDVWAEITWNANAATTWTTLEGSISQTSATLATTGKVRGTTYSSLNQISAAATNGVTTLELGPMVLNVSSTTNIFLVVKGAFATNIIGAYGFIMARRRA